MISPFSNVSADIVSRLGVVSLNNQLIASAKCQRNAELTYRPVDDIEYFTDFYLTSAEVLKHSEVSKIMLKSIKTMLDNKKTLR